MDINSEFVLGQRPILRLLTEEQKRRIHEGSLELLERTGSDFQTSEPSRASRQKTKRSLVCP